MRSSSKKINPTLKKTLATTFDQLLADLKDPKDIRTFLLDFMEESEYEMYVKRLAVAYWLKKKRTYANISENLKVSSATVASIHKKVESEGIKLALKNIEAEEWANQWAEKFKGLTKRQKTK